MKHLYVIGDSISIQYGPYLEQALQGSLIYARKDAGVEAQLGLDNPQGDNGGDSSSVLRFLQAMRDADALKTDLLLLNCGLHDIKTRPQSGEKQVSLPQYNENLQAILQVVVDLPLTLIWVRTTPCDEHIHNRPEMQFHRFAADCEAYNTAADQIMEAAGIPMIDLYTFTRNQGSDIYCDHVHFHDPIRQRQATFIAGWLAGWLTSAASVPSNIL